jgi:hypothetical protein
VATSFCAWDLPPKLTLTSVLFGLLCRRPFAPLWAETPMEPRRTRTEEALHAQAQKCQRLASESLDPFVREALIELASHYEHQADRLEQQRQESER